MGQLNVSKARKSRALILLLLTGLLLFYNWVHESKLISYIEPQEEQTDIEYILSRNPLTESEIDALSKQTGLHGDVIRTFLNQGKEELLLQLQQLYFAPVRVGSKKSTPFTVCEFLVDEEGREIIGMPLVDICDGDILVTKNSRFFGWRNGHAALVVDAEKGLLLEAIMLGADTKISNIEKWSKYPSFQVLRLKEEYAQGGLQGKDVSNPEVKEDKDIIEQSVPQKVAKYARNNLLDIPYSLTAELAEKIWKKDSARVYAKNGMGENTDRLAGTHCAHIVWYAYKQFGIDLDSDGGLFVTPEDIRNSEYLEVIQTYGY